MRTFFAGLTGANCTLGDQTILSLEATEDIDADYDTASAICIGDPLPKGEMVETVEGGMSTGLWEVEDPVLIRSNKRTWKRPHGGEFEHIPMVSYQLRRKGYLQGRATLSKSTIGKDAYPPKFCTTARYREMTQEINERVKDGELSSWDARRELGSWHVIAAPSDIIMTCTSWVGLPVSFGMQLEACVPEYVPVSKSVMSVCKEVAGWSGGSCYLSREGTLQIFDWQEQYSRGGRPPAPPTVLEEEWHDSLYPTLQCTVVGKGRGRVWIPPQPGRFRPPGGNPNIPAYDPPRPGHWYYGRTIEPVEETVTFAGAPGEYVVEERIEISEYEIFPELARRIAAQVVTKAVLRAGAVTMRGPAEGAQEICPLTHRVFQVHRSLQWNGTAYRYFIDMTAPAGSLGGGESGDGW
ncbi:MAG: hypothetical protein JW990_12010 [Thermoleophilia bacterium]|nr:hypothetical protein [Thermoleophilia bacterium]